MLRALPLCIVVLSCSSSAPMPIAPAPPPTASEAQGSADNSSSAPGASTSGLGEKCGENGACATGQTCVRYFGVAGPSGPELTSCEIPCKDGATCPASMKCVTVADGPGEVCRP